jgi:HAE1 family hydrophobic/amphiphilic exporter-1
MWLTNFALKRPVITAMFFIGIALYGFISYRSLGVSLFPNVSFPIVVVQASYPGASPSEMERLIIKPIEDQLDGIDNLDRLSATAQEGVATIIVRFKLDTDLNFAVMDVQRRVNQATGYMPADLVPPFVGKFSTASDPILTEALSSKTLTGPQLSDLVVQQIIPALKRTNGVQDVDYTGVAEREFHVNPDTNRLLSTGATLTDINNAISLNNANLPGGRMDTPTQETTVSIHADINDPSDILRLPLAVPGGAQSILRIGNVATVEDGHVEIRQPAKYNQASAVVLYVQRTIDADEIKTTEAVRKTFKELQKEYPGIKFAETDANADYTRQSVNGVLQNLMEGVFLTAIVMLLFLHAWRNALVVMIAIPTSLLATFIVMNLLGFRIDVISLMGLGLTIGILVDDSIVVLENITRHRDMGESPMEAAYNGRTEIGQAAVTITLVDVVVFLPIAFLSGILGKYMREFGVVIVVATLFSLLVSFTLTPLLAGRWSVKQRSPAVPVWAAWFQRLFNDAQHWYSTKVLPLALANRLFVAVICALLVLDSFTLPVSPPAALMLNLAFAVGAFLWYGLARLLRGTSSRFAIVRSGASSFRPIAVAAVSAIVIGLCFAALPKVGGEFIPSTDSGVVSGTITFPVGTPLGTTDAALDKLAAEIAKVPDVKQLFTTAGRKSAGGFGSIQGGHVAQFTAVLDESKRSETNRVTDDIRKLGWTVPGAELQVAAEGSGQPISFTLTGEDSQLNEAAEKLATFIRAQKGAVNVTTSAETQAPRLNINIDPIRASTVGVSPGDAALAARIAVGGAIPTRVRTEKKLVDVRLQLAEADRNDLTKIQQIRVRGAQGQLVPLSQIAEFQYTKAPTKIEREARARVVRVSAAIDPGQKIAQGDILGPIQKALNTPGFLPNGVKAVAADDTDLYNQTVSSMGLALLTSFMLVYALMVILYGSFFEPFIVMFAVPVAVIGALVGLSIRHQTLNLFSLIAIVMLFGLVAKNGILLVDYANQQLRRGLPVADAIRAAAATRFRPILMTTCAMVFGMLPLALGLTEGAKDRASMGSVLIGGLTSSLILTLVLVPVVYTWVMTPIERWRHRHPKTQAEEEVRELPSFQPVGAQG